MKKDFVITREDGFSLAATAYRPKEIKGVVMIAPATGIKRQFYNSFASYLAENKYAAICFDNEGIGGSLRGNLSKSVASLVSWGRLDMTSVFKYIQNEFPKSTYHLVGHSAGGQLIGLMNGADKLSSLFNFACSSGSIRNMNYPFKAKAHFFMNGFIPLSNLVLGYTDSPKMGMGEALPKQVAKEWSVWCNSEGYIQYYLDKYKPKHSYLDLNFPSKWVHATDDDIANLTNVKDMIRVFPKLPHEIVSLDPKEHGFNDLGHMKFFSKRRKSLWPMALDWINKHNDH